MWHFSLEGAVHTPTGTTKKTYIRFDRSFQIIRSTEMRFNQREKPRFRFAFW